MERSIPGLLFWTLFATLLISSSGFDCAEPTGDTRLASLEIEVLRVNRIAFDTGVRVYEAGIPAGATTVTVRAQAMDPEATVSWLVPDGTGGLPRGIIGVGGGTITLDLPPGGYALYVGAHPLGGAIGGYSVTFIPCDHCSDGNDCTSDICDLASGACSNPDEVDGLVCDVGGLRGMCASGACEEGQPAHPTGLGPYNVGYTTFVAEDPARVIDPNAVTIPRWTLGQDGNWPLYLRVM